MQPNPALAEAKFAAKYPSEVTLGELLDEIVDALARFIVAETEMHQVLALFAAHTHVFEACQVTPYLDINSPTRRCGKSSVLKALKELCSNCDEILVNPSDATVYRWFGLYAEGEPTFLIDEADRLLKDSKNKPEQIAMYNAGFERGAIVPRSVGSNAGEQRVERFPVFAPRAFASIGGIKDEALLDRCISIKLRRKTRAEKVERARARQIAAVFGPLGEHLAAWSALGAVAEIAEAEPNLPDELDDRAQDFSEILLAIADAAGSHWPGSARRALVHLCAGRDLDDDSLGVDLLRRCHAAFHPSGAVALEALHTQDLITSICTKDEASPWRQWWWDEKDAKPNSKAATQLGRRLRDFEIDREPNAIQIGESQKRGYRREAFEDVWRRYAIDAPPNKVSTRQPAPKTGDFAGENGLTPLDDVAAGDGEHVNPQTRMVDTKNGLVDRLTCLAGGGERVRDIPNAEVRRLLDAYRPELVGRDDLTTPDERREIAATYLLAERNGSGPGRNRNEPEAVRCPVCESSDVGAITGRCHNCGEQVREPAQL